MKKLILAAVLYLFTTGLASCDGTESWGHPWNGGLYNYDGSEVTDRNLDATLLTGKWKVVGRIDYHSNSKGEHVPYLVDIRDNIPLPYQLHWTYSFESDGRGEGREYGRSILTHPTEPYPSEEGGEFQDDPAVEWDFGWSLSGRRLRLNHDMEPVYADEELAAFFLEKYSHIDRVDPAPPSVEAAVELFLTGDMAQWMITELTPDKLVLCHREESWIEDPKETWYNEWFIFEKVEE